MIDSRATTKILSSGHGYRGLLQDIKNPDGKDMLLALIGHEWIELPQYLAVALWSMVGQKIIVARFGGDYSAGRCSS